MPLARSYPARLCRLLVWVSAAATLAAPGREARAQTLPARIADSVFWRMVTDMSEPGGYFRSDNFVSNETSFQYVIPALNRITSLGGAYLGVGPDQNFTYIVALRPRIAFVVDIRRQNMIEHLMYKAIIELSADRADFVSRLFSRPRPAGLDTMSSAVAIFGAYEGVAVDTALARRTFTAIKTRLMVDHGFGLSADDVTSLQYVFNNFLIGGPELTYSGPSGRGGRGVTYAQLMVTTDGEGVHRSYLANEGNYRALRDFESSNLLVPLVGDFGGPRALGAAGQYLKEHGATVTAFYVSNVEQYLFQQEDTWRRFYTTVGTLPMDSTSTFIRSVFGGGRGGLGGAMTGSLLSSIPAMVAAFKAGRVLSYSDVISMSR